MNLRWPQYPWSKTFASREIRKATSGIRTGRANSDRLQCKEGDNQPFALFVPLRFTKAECLLGYRRRASSPAAAEAVSLGSKTQYFSPPA